MTNKKLTHIILVAIGLLALIIFLILPIFSTRINPFSNCGTYDEQGDLHSTCVCHGIRTRIDNSSKCWGLRIDHYE